MRSIGLYCYNTVGLIKPARYADIAWYIYRNQLIKWEFPFSWPTYVRQSRSLSVAEGNTLLDDWLLLRLMANGGVRRSIVMGGAARVDNRKRCGYRGCHMGCHLDVNHSTAVHME